MAIVKIQNNFLSDEVKTIFLDKEVSVESLIKENIDDSVYEDTLVECYDLETGKTYFAPLEENKDTINAIVQVNGKDVDLSYIVKDEDNVCIVITPSGDNWSWWGAVSGALTGGLAGLEIGAAIGGWGGLIGFAIGVVVGFVAGGLIGGALKPNTDDMKASSGIDSEKLPDVRGATNQPMTDQPFPAVLGKHLAVPFIVGSPYNDISGAHGESNYIQVLYCVGYAPLRITDIKLGEQYLAHNQRWSGNENLKNIWQGIISGTDSGAGSGTDAGEIVNTWKNNDVSLEILQQVPGEEVKYGSIYPFAKIQRDIKANVLFIADGSLEEIDRGDNISYKGLGLQNGLRNNPIYFSEQYPKSLKVELDFANGLYKTRSETSNNESTVHYYKIPMWVAIQWRVYSDDNDTADGANAGQVALPTWNSAKQKYNLIDGGAKRGWNTFKTINKVNMGWEDNNKNPALTSSVTISYNADTTSESFGYTLTINKITTDAMLDGEFTVKFTYKRGNTPTTLEYTFPANTTRMDINRSIQFRDLANYVKVDVIPQSVGFNSGSAERTNSGNLSIAVGGQIPAKLYTDAYRQADFAAHTGNTLPATLNDGWINRYVFNLEELGGTNDNKDGINEFRCITEVDLIEWAKENLKAAGDSDETFVNKVKSYFFDSSNSTRSIEVRVVRVSPNYIDETVSTSDKSAFKFNDIFTWETLSSTMLDGDELMKRNRIVQKRPLPEEDMRKLCLIALRAKTDNVDQLSNTIRKFSCVAESFAPYYDDTEKKWFPENVKTKKGYYRYVEEGGEEKWISITEQQYYEDRQNGTTYTDKGIKSKCLPAGNDFVEQIINEVINIPSHRDTSGRIFIPNKDKEAGVYKPGCDGTLNFCNNNVASVFLFSGIGPHLGNDALGYSQSNYAENGIGDFNMDSLSTWYKWAEDVTDGSTYSSNGYHINHDGEKVPHNKDEAVHIYFTANAYVYSTEMLENVLANIAVAGRAVYTRDSKNRLCVIIDKPEQFPVGLINQKNTLKSSYSISYAELPSGIQLAYPDEDDGYNQNQLYCMTDGEDAHNPHGAIEQFSFKFVTNNIQLWSLGRYMLANRIMNRETVTKQLGAEGATFALGDLVMLQDETMLIGTDNGGRITQLIEDSNYIYGFLINDAFHFTGKMKAGTQESEQGVVVMQPGQYREYRVITLQLAALGTEIPVGDNLYVQVKGMTNVVLLKDAIAKNQSNQEGGDYYVYKPEVGNLVGFGIVDKVSALYRIIKIKPAEKNKYDFTLLQYQDALYNYGSALPSFQNNMTVPDRSGENSFSLSSGATQVDLVKNITESSRQVAGVVKFTFSKVPNTPSNLTMTVDKEKLDFSCSIVEDGISNVDYILYEIKRDDGTTKQIKGGFAGSYFFNRGIDGFPERSELANWQIRAKAVTVYTDENDERIASAWSSYVNITTASLQLYGTWQPATPSFISKIPNENTITLDWNAVSGTGGYSLYGENQFELKILYNGVAKHTIVTKETHYIYSFDRDSNADGYPEKVHDADHKGLDLYTFDLKVFNESAKNASVTGQTFSNSEVQNYKTWIIPQVTVSKEVLDRTAILTAVYGGSNEVYGKILTLVKIKRSGNSDTVGSDPNYTYNDLFAITPDEEFYTPEFDASVQTSVNDNEPHYRKNTTTDFTSLSNKISHTLPLIGQTARIYKLGNVPILENGYSKDNYTDEATAPVSPSQGDMMHYTGTSTDDFVHGAYYQYDGAAWVRKYSLFTKDVSDYSTIPSSPTEDMVIHFIGNDPDFDTGAYYLYENNEWVGVYSKSLMVPTTYVYSISMTNESGSVSTATDTEVIALGTNIADVVHSHEHYKDLYVEKLSAINANLGMISQGGMGDFESNTNCWALSDLSPEDSGVVGGVMKGTFRVGDENEYFRVTPHKSETDPTGRYYTIELKAGNIELTSDVSGESAMDFTNGTYIYSNDRHSRMKLTPNGIIVQKYNGTDLDKWSDETKVENVSQVIGDSLGNMIVTNINNFEDAYPIGTQTASSDVIYHFDNVATHEEVGEGETATNPKGISCVGNIISTKDKNPILLSTSSKTCFDGDVTVPMTSFTGTVVAFSKSDKLLCNGVFVTPSGVVDNAGALNTLMSQTKDSGTVGSYLGLSSSQISSGIFKNY